MVLCLIHPGWFQHIIPHVIGWIVPLRNRAVRWYVAQQRKSFVDLLQKDLHSHGSVAFKLIRDRQPRDLLPPFETLTKAVDVWDEVWRGTSSGNNVVVELAQENTRSLIAQGDVDTNLSHITVDHFQHVAKRYPASKSLGCDGWRAHEFAMLPPACVQTFVNLLNNCVDHLTFPSEKCCLSW